MWTFVAICGLTVFLILLHVLAFFICLRLYWLIMGFESKIGE